MCLPCFPWTWTQYEDPLDSMPPQHVWVREGSSWAMVRANRACNLGTFTSRTSLPSSPPSKNLGSVATGPAATPHFFNTAANQHHHPPHFAPNVTFIGQPQPVMPDYSNTAPHPVGFNFQPPVPDTTFGPMSHLFVPRFDAVPTPSPAGPHGIVPGAYPAGPPGYVFAPQAYAAQQQQQQQQPIMINGQAYVPVAAAPGQPYPPQMMPGGYAMVNGAPVPVMTPGNENKLPDVSGMSRTPNEEMLRQIQFAHENKLFEPQDFKPGDDDPSRFYYVRELDVWPAAGTSPTRAGSTPSVCRTKPADGNLADLFTVHGTPATTPLMAFLRDARHV
ncbi:hypothetical protein XA68_10108 [Ophiocordyceps unilateralis]|uniref:Uncharacterized protein n=1 Tax=Ophiocordyceps unilateralis TaxID=268505 RepID=A0A2A9PJ45_OPHUN|nr:hypothetical protein XA68_10108 [Ophiocordyceps unilateralis]